MGIGPGVDKNTLQLIAGEGNPVVQVEDFSQLENMMGTIKSSACSCGTSKIEQTLHFFCRSLDRISDREIWKMWIMLANVDTKTNVQKYHGSSQGSMKRISDVENHRKK